MRIRNCSKGFTYIELAIAMAIIALIILAFTQLFLNSAVSFTSMKFQTIAYNLAASTMEQLRMTPFASIGNETQAQTLSGNTFTCNVTISQLANSLKEADIKVSWTEKGQNRNIGISSLISAF
jgi:prepilin-type N-terminal cleavage/methylation domain-containing protein